MVMDITRIAYEKYKLKWMLDHGYDLSNLLGELEEMHCEYPDQTPCELFDNWVADVGFSSEIWACYDEFMENEFLNSDYMMSILTSYERYEYARYRTKGGIT